MDSSRRTRPSPLQRIADGGLPKGSGLAADIRSGVARLRSKLDALELDSVGMSDYSSQYLSEALLRDGYQLNVTGHVLFRALNGTGSDPAALTVLDYGGGNGLLSLLAREMGVGTVLFNDIFDGSCADARLLAKRLGLEADDYVNGDLGAVIAFLRERTMRCDVVVSYDVIEHIYDIEQYLRELPSITAGPLRVVMASAANTLNPRRTRQLMATHRLVELQDRAPEIGHKERDALRAYANIRAGLIRAHAPDMPPGDVAALTTATRGMMTGDIERAVDRFINGSGLPSPDHPTNTCDPLTGNWAEHLMDPFRLADVLTEAGVPAHIETGFYGFHTGVRGVAATALNAALRLTGKAGLRIAPYYILVGHRQD